MRYRSRRYRAARWLAPLLVLAFLVSGCGFRGLNSLPLPGAAGSGEGSYVVWAVIPNANNLVLNAPVLMDDADIGSVGTIDITPQWQAKVKVRIKKGVSIPVGSHVMVGMTSVLGSMHLEIVRPENATSASLPPDTTIPLATCPQQDNVPAPRTSPPVADLTAAQQVEACTYPSTEQTFSAISVILNGGGLSDIGDLVHELNSAVSNRGDNIVALLPRIQKVANTLARQRNTIITALTGLDTLARTVKEQEPILQRALRDGPEILKLLVAERQNFTTTMTSLGHLADTANQIITSSRGDIKSIVNNLNPFLDQLAAAGPSLTSSLNILGTYPFPERYLRNMARGDWLNLDLTLDLSAERVSDALMTIAGVPSRTVGPEAIFGIAGLAGKSVTNFRPPAEVKNP